MLFTIVVFFLSQSGFIVWHSLRTVCYHYLRTLHVEETVTLAIPNEKVAEIIWVKKDEVRYQGKMFDVKDRSATDTSLLLTGHFDSKDDKLFKWLKHLLENDEEQQSGKQKTSFWFYDAVIHPVVQIVPSHNYRSVQKHLMQPSFFLNSQTKQIVSPPPEYCIS